MPDKSYSFYKPEAPRFELERNLPVEVLSTGRERRSSRDYCWNNERHPREPYHVLQYTLSGSGAFEFDLPGGPAARRVARGQMLLASWDRRFEYRFEGGEAWEFVWITLAGSFADAAVAELREPEPIMALPAGSAPALFLSSLQERLAGPNRIDRYALTCLGYEFLVQLLKERSGSSATPEERFLAEAGSFVARNLRTASVATLAGHFGYGEKYFNDFFKRRAATTPHRFIVDRRLRYAASLLLGTRKRIHAVAAETGFSEDNYFSKVFRRRFGLSPVEYRRRNRDIVPADELVVL
jgi:AraC-like DNA-binding protein